MTADSAPMLAKGFHGKFKSPIAQLGDVVTLHYGKALAAPVRRPGNIPVYGSNGQCGWHDVPLRQGPTVVLGRKGQGPLGVKWCSRPFWVIDTAYYVSIDPVRIDLRYFYYLTGYIGLNHLKDGTSNPSLRRDVFCRQAVPLPSLPTQRKIAGILSAYDDLIENNLRRIKILEQMAQSLYREWFVYFRFPGHESVRFDDSEFGQIPKGWEVKKLKKVCVLTMGQSPKSEYYNDRGEGTPFHQGVTNFGDYFPTDRLYSTEENRIAEEGDILFSVRAPVGRINVANKRIVIGRGVSAIRECNCHQDFLLFQLKHLFQEEDSMGNGAIFKAVTKADMEDIKLLLPKESWIERFEKAASPIFSNLKNLTQRNRILRRTRDILLPKLIA